LETLWCHRNQLTSLDVSKNNALAYLGCSDNQLTTLDVSNQSDLLILWCGGNQLTSLDVSNNSFLGQHVGYTFSCFLEIGDMPSLEKVCVWTMPFPPEGFLLCADGSPNAYFTTDCSK